MSCPAKPEPPLRARDLPGPGLQLPTINPEVDGVGTKAIRGRRAGNTDASFHLEHEARQTYRCGASAPRAALEVLLPHPFG